MRLEAFIVRRAFALKFFTLFRFSFVGYLQNFDNACLRCFMASLHSSLYHGLLFFGFVEVFGILLLEISRREEVKSSRGSKEFLNLSILRLQKTRKRKKRYFLGLGATSRLTVPGLTDTLLHRNPGQKGVLSHQERPNSQ